MNTFSVKFVTGEYSHVTGDKIWSDNKSYFIGSFDGKVLYQVSRKDVVCISPVIS